MERVPSVLSVYGQAGAVRGAGDRELAVGIGDAGEAGGREHQRDRERRPRRVVDGSGSPTPRRTRGWKPMRRNAARVLGHGALVFGAAVDVVEHAAGQPAAGHDAQVVHVRGPGEAARDGIELEAAEPHHRPQCFDHRPNARRGSDEPGGTSPWNDSRIDASS